MVTRLAHRPHVYLARSFLSDAECDHIAALAAASADQAAVATTASEDNFSRSWRQDCQVSGHSPFADEGLMALTRDAAHFAFCAEAMDSMDGNAETLQVLRYAPGGQYKLHFDASWDECPRAATILYYLEPAPVGGETWFPLACDDAQGVPINVQDAVERACAADEHQSSGEPRPGLSVKGGRGDALLFYNLDARGDLELCALHAGLPVIGGTKLIASQFMQAQAAVRPPADDTDTDT